MDFNDEIKSDEIKLVGSWIQVDKKVVGDVICKRIDWLKNHYLKKIATDESGWEILYQDPNDKRYWVLTYPHGDWHGGGPPALQTLSQTEVRAKFKID